MEWFSWKPRSIANKQRKHVRPRDRADLVLPGLSGAGGRLPGTGLSGGISVREGRLQGDATFLLIQVVSSRQRRSCDGSNSIAFGTKGILFMDSMTPSIGGVALPRGTTSQFKIIEEKNIDRWSSAEGFFLPSPLFFDLAIESLTNAREL